MHFPPSAEPLSEPQSHSAMMKKTPATTATLSSSPPTFSSSTIRTPPQASIFPPSPPPPPPSQARNLTISKIGIDIGGVMMHTSSEKNFPWETVRDNVVRDAWSSVATLCRVLFGAHNIFFNMLRRVPYAAQGRKMDV